MTRLVCLANSKKHGAHCVAGIDLATNQWIRPVSDLDDGRILRETRLVDGREPKLLEILEIPLAETGPDFGYEPENRSLEPGAWKLAGCVFIDWLHGFASQETAVMLSTEPFVTLEWLRDLPPDRRRSLDLVEASDFRIVNRGPSVQGGHKWNGVFTRGGVTYSFPISDPFFTEKLERGYEPAAHVLLTISLSMPYFPRSWNGEGTPCWKLIAAVIEMEPGRGRPDRETPAAAPKPTTGPKRDPLQVLREDFGFSEFRGRQEEVIRAILAGRDTLAVMPTGAGKSLCYQLPSRLLPGAVVVVSPLIALMKDQVEAARRFKLRVARFDCTVDETERIAVLGAVQSGQLDLLLVSPERLVMENFLNHLKRSPIALLAIDEAHCISEWGHDFRPDYLFLHELHDHFPGAPIAAFTATATPDVQAEIAEKLALRDPFIARDSFDRPNLNYTVRRDPERDEAILAYLQNRPNESGIVYCATKKRVNALAEFLSEFGAPALPYHAGLDPATRRANQDAFLSSRARIIVATVAFGMGIDKPDVRFVIHASLPKNLESFYQETGRAGRDGKPADCVLFFDESDLARRRRIVKTSAERSRLEAMAHFATSGEICRRRLILAYFGEEFRAQNCGRCDVCAPGGGLVQAAADAMSHGDAIGASLQKTWNYARRGWSATQIAERRGLAESTILGHFVKLIDSGRKIDIAPYVTAETRDEARRLLAEIGADKLKPVVEASGGRVSYEQARLVRAELAAEK